MTEWPSIPPKKILLATDLDARSDRALDRAAELARQWKATLIVVHATEREPVSLNNTVYDELPSWRRPPDPGIAIERQLRRDLKDAVPHLKIVIQEGSPQEVILDVVNREQCDLIVIGAARDRMLGPVFLGRTVDHLVRRSPVSVLVVRNRPRGRYVHVLVGTDFTEESKYGLSVAAKLFPSAVFAVMHAFELPYRALWGKTQLSQDFAAMEGETIRAFVADADLPKEVASGINTLIEHGSPVEMMRNYIIEKNADLTVIGTLGRGLLFHLVIGGNAPKIVEGVPSDVLVVRSPLEKT